MNDAAFWMMIDAAADAGSDDSPQVVHHCVGSECFLTGSMFWDGVLFFAFLIGTSILAWRIAAGVFPWEKEDA